MSQQTFADLMGVGQQTVSAWEHGARMMDAVQILNASKVLNCSIYGIYDGLFEVGTATRLSDELSHISDDDRMVIKHVVTHWTGDLHALIQCLGMYCSVPPSLRADIAGMCIHQYERAVESGIADRTMELDTDYIENSWQKIAKDDNKI